MRVVQSVLQFTAGGQVCRSVFQRPYTEALWNLRFVDNDLPWNCSPGILVHRLELFHRLPRRRGLWANAGQQTDAPRVLPEGVAVRNVMHSSVLKKETAVEDVRPTQ